MRLYNEKVVISGNLIQVYNYAKPIYKEYEQKHEKTRATEGIRSSKSLNRLRNNVALTIESNLTKYTKFITLTTAKPIYDLEQFQLIFKNFKRKFKRLFGKELKYIGVVEKQYKRQEKFNLPDAPLHFHLIVFMDDYLPFKQLKSIWGMPNDSIDIKRVKNTEVSRYLMKYITKEHIQFNKKGILKSRNLKEPQTFVSMSNENIFVPEYYSLMYQTTYFILPKDANNVQLIDKINECTMREYRLTHASKHKYDLKQGTWSYFNPLFVSESYDTNQP